MKIWRCSVCGYIHEGDEAPLKCPKCNNPREKFVEVNEDGEQITAKSESIHINYAQKATQGNEVVVVPLFEDYTSIAPFIYNLPAGQDVKLHKHPSTDELFYIIRGQLEFKVGDETFTVQEGVIIQGKMNVPHSFKNIGKEHASFLSVKGPKPVDLEMIEE